MSAPEFTSDEQYIISYYKSDFARTMFSAWPFHLPLVVIFALGMWHDNSLAMFAAFVSMIGYRVWENSHQPRYHAATRSIIEKYETAIAASSAQPEKAS
jgi:hypothetical protein